jgi:hypothetical protein
VYEKSLNPSNLHAAFKKTAIYENNNADNNDTIEKRADESIFCIRDVEFLRSLFLMILDIFTVMSLYANMAPKR